MNLPNFGIMDALIAAPLAYGILPSLQEMLPSFFLFMALLNLLTSFQFKYAASFYMTHHQFHMNNVLSDNCISTWQLFTTQDFTTYNFTKTMVISKCWSQIGLSLLFENQSCILTVSSLGAIVGFLLNIWYCENLTLLGLHK